MIRAETETHWLLVTHPDHAHLAGQVADAWGNAEFARPEPFAPIRYATYHHDDGWLARDAKPSLTPAGIPEAFTRDLVGAYSAFEEIDLPSYLAVRGAATAAVAAQDPTAGIIVSMHTVNLLTEQADESTIQPEHRAAHAAFVAAQRAWQTTEGERLGLNLSALQRGFEFLQACDNLSLIACSGFAQPRPLRHRHPDRTGQLREIQCQPQNPTTWKLDPWPLAADTLELTVSVRRLPKDSFTDEASYRSAFTAAPIKTHEILLTRK